MNILEIIKRKKANITLSFNDVVEEWLSYKKRMIKKSSYSNYEYMINKYLRPYLQEKKIIELERYNFNDLINELNLELAPKTVRDIICVLKSILNYIENEYGGKIKTKKIIAPQLDVENIIVFSKGEKRKIAFSQSKNDSEVPVTNKKSKAGASEKPKVLEYAEVIDIEDPDKETIQ